MKNVALILFLTALAFPVMTQAVERTANGKIYRSRTEIARFKRMHPCPATGLPHGPCRGWVIDHKIPLACNGPDSVRNMQWQTRHEAKIKDRWERMACRG